MRNTDTIAIHGGTRASGIGLDLRGGPFAPGATREQDGTSEIEIVVDMNAKAPTFLIDGSDDPDTIFAGADGVALNADQDVDLTSIGTPPAWNILAGGGDDVVSLAGGHGTGAPVHTGGNRVSGDTGNDQLTGGDGTDRTDGPGDDVVHGGGGKDRLVIYGGGHDDAYGEGGADTFVSESPGRARRRRSSAATATTASTSPRGRPTRSTAAPARTARSSTPASTR